MNTLPLSAAELCDALRHGRSVDPARLNRILAVDARRGLLEVQGETAWATIAAEVRPGDVRAAAVRTTMATVGASIACNSAGPDGQPAVAHVHALTLATPDGELRRLSRAADRELFSLVVGGHGVFGVLYSATLRMESLVRAVERAGAPERRVLRPSEGTQALELLLPPQCVEPFIAEAQAQCSEWRIPLGSVELRGTLAEDDSFLRWASRDFVAAKLGFCAAQALGARVRSAQLRRSLIDAAIAAGGRFQIASTREATRAQSDACYPRLREFLAHKRRFDPRERLSNAWYRHQRALLAAEAGELRWNH